MTLNRDQTSSLIQSNCTKSHTLIDFNHINVSDIFFCHQYSWIISGGISENVRECQKEILQRKIQKKWLDLSLCPDPRQNLMRSLSAHVTSFHRVPWISSCVVSVKSCWETNKHGPVAAWVRKRPCFYIIIIKHKLNAPQFFQHQTHGATAALTLHDIGELGWFMWHEDDSFHCVAQGLFNRTPGLAWSRAISRLSPSLRDVVYLRLTSASRQDLSADHHSAWKPARWDLDGSDPWLTGKDIRDSGSPLQFERRCHFQG